MERKRKPERASVYNLIVRYGDDDEEDYQAYGVMMEKEAGSKIDGDQKFNSVANNATYASSLPMNHQHQYSPFSHTTTSQGPSSKSLQIEGSSVPRHFLNPRSRSPHLDPDSAPQHLHLACSSSCPVKVVAVVVVAAANARTPFSPLLLPLPLPLLRPPAQEADAQTKPREGTTRKRVLNRCGNERGLEIW